MPDYGNTFATATLINNDSTTDGEIHAGNQDDYFRIVLAQDAPFIIIEDLLGLFDSEVKLYDSNETQLSSDSDSGLNTSFRLVVNHVVAGTYYIRVHGYVASSLGLYSLYIRTSLDNYDSIETLNTITDSSPLPITSIADTMVEHDSINTAWQITDPTTHFNVYGVEDIHANNFNGFTIPTEYRIPKMIMMGHRQGVSTPLIQGDAIRYKVHGTVKAEGVALNNKLVRLYDRKTGQLIGETRSDALGVYTFPNPLWQSSKYYVIAFDDVDAPDLQAVIHDALIPIAQ